MYQRYPVLFTQKSWSIKESCMPFGISVGYGWSSIIDRVCQDVMSWWEENKDSLDEGFEPQFVQIKEKWGLLRIYMNCDGWDPVFRITQEAEMASGYICEECGTGIDVTTEGGWLLTLCGKCRSDRDNERTKWRFMWRMKTRRLRWKIREWLLRVRNLRKSIDSILGRQNTTRGTGGKSK